jgi:hypothetical protein
MATALQSRVSLLGGLYQWSDFEDGRAPTYKDRLAAPVRIEKALPELFSGIPGVRRATVTVKNVTRDPATLTGGTLDRWLDNPIYDPTLADISSQETGIYGTPASVALYDLDAAASILSLDGVIADLSMTLEEGQMTIEALDADAFERPLPTLRILDVFPNADLTQSNDPDAPVIVVFGPMRKVPLTLVQSGPGYFDYGPIRYHATLSVSAVYRDAAVVNPSEYSLVQVTATTAVIRFTRDQRDGAGRLFQIQADLTSTEFPRPSDVVRFLLQNVDYGLGKTVNAASFATAATNYAAVSYTVGGGLATRRRAADIFRDLLLRGAVLDKDSSGAYTITVDTSALHTAASVTLGLGDNYGRNNILSAHLAPKRIEERVKTYTLKGLIDPGFQGNGAYLLTATRTRPEPGRILEESNPYIIDATTLDRECDYRFKRLKWADKALSVDVEPEAKAIGLNQLVTVDIPSLRLLSSVWECASVAAEANKFTLGLRGYNAEIFTYTAGTVQAAPGANTQTDYTFTLPGTPTNFAVAAVTIETAADGRKIARTTLQADAPSVNVTHLVFETFRTSGSTVIPARTQRKKVTAGATAVQVDFRLRPGVTYDLQVYAQNVANHPDFQNGPAAQILGHVGGTDTTPPAIPSGVTATAKPGLILIDWANNTEPDLSEYGVYRFTSNTPASATKIAEVRASQFADTTGTAGQTYYYWVTAFDRYENESAKSTVASATFQGSASSDPPANPAAFTLDTTSTYQSSDGRTLARIRINAPPMPAGAAYMNILFRVTGTIEWKIATQRSTGGGQPRIDDLTPGIQYDIAAQAFSGGGGASAITQMTDNPVTAPGDTTAPATVTGVSATAGTGKSVTVTWTQNTEADLAGYVIYRGTAANPTVEYKRVGKGNTFVDENVSYGTTYHYRIKAIDFTGNQSASYSSNVSATPSTLVTSDHTNNSITTPKRQNTNVITLNIGLDGPAGASTPLGENIGNNTMSWDAPGMTFTPTAWSGNTPGTGPRIAVTTYRPSQNRFIVHLYNGDTGTWSSTLRVEYW